MQKKKPIIYSALAIIFVLAVAACASAPAPEPGPVSASVPDPVPVPLPDPAALDELIGAIRGVSNHLNSTIPEGITTAFINVQSGSEELSNFIIDNLIANAVNDRIFPVVDRHELDRIREELGFQLSAEVDDATARSIGQFSGAYTIVTGRVTSFGGHFHLTTRALNVETALVQGQHVQNIGTQAAINALIGNGGRQVAQAAQPMRQVSPQLPFPPAAPVPAQQAAAQAPAQQAQPITQAPTQPLIQAPAQAAETQPGEILVTGTSLEEKIQWLRTNAANNTRYHIELRRDERITPQTLSFPRVRNVTIRLSGAGGERVISLWEWGTLFTVESGVTLILDSGITLQGSDRNHSPLVIVDNRGELIMNAGAMIFGNENTNGIVLGGGVLVEGHGTFIMNGGEISGNRASHRDGSGGGVHLGRNGSFTMTEGIISGNAASASGGGVYMSPGTTFTINGGKIVDNFSSIGGGVLVGANGNFNMIDGVIYGNEAVFAGGGVSILAGATFTMTSGEISGNSAGSNGGGVYGRTGATFAMRGGELYGNTAANGGGVSMGGSFTMVDGKILGNTASGQGGGVLVVLGGSFAKTGGTIYGSAGIRNDNRASNGHAVFLMGPPGTGLRNTTAGPGIRLDSRTIGALGGWES